MTIIGTVIVGVIPWLIESLIKTLFSWTIWKFLTRGKKDQNDTNNEKTDVDKDTKDKVS